MRRPRHAAPRPPDRRTPIIFAVVAIVFFAWGIIASSSVAVALAGTAVGVLLFAAQTWAVHLAAGVTGRPVAVWRSAALAAVATALETLERVAVPSPCPWGTVAAMWLAECFVLAILAQHLLPAGFGRAFAVALLSRLFAFLAYLALMFALFACLVAWFQPSWSLTPR